MRATLNIIGGVILGVITVDVLGFMLWALSGQHPADAFYIGTITAHILRAIIN